MEIMNLRNEYMKKIVAETLQKIQNEIVLPSNPRYKKVLKDTIVQGCIKLLEPKVLLKIREKDLQIISEIIPEAEWEFKALMLRETKAEGKYSTELTII